jgi:hypothetical protein
MTTKLDSVLKRELTIGGEPYTLTISPEGFSLTIKGHRKGLDIGWADLIGGDAALATALNASLTANIVPRGKTVAKTAPGAKIVAKAGDARGKGAEKPSEPAATTAAKARAKAAAEMLWPRGGAAKKRAAPAGSKPAARAEPPRGRAAKVVKRSRTPAARLKRK